MSLITKLRLAIIAVLVTLIGLMIGLQWQQRQTAKTSDEVCDASNQWCQGEVSGATVDIRIKSPQEDQIITPTPISIQLSGLANADTVKVRLSGYNMYMGQFDIELRKFSNNQDYNWQADTPLPNCTPDHDMIWRVDFVPPHQGTFYFTSTEYEATTLPASKAN